MDNNLVYKWAKQLKDAGFHQGGQGKIFTSNGQEWPTIIGGKKQLEDFVYFPTLSELIKACGDKFAELGKGNSPIDHKWTASGFPIKPGFCGNGKTSEEAVANLWFKLNEKESKEEITWICHHGIFHEIGCPHQKWSVEDLQHALEAKKNQMIIIQNYPTFKKDKKI